MSRPVHSMPEALISRPSATAWGCTDTPGWVPYPKKIPRRHPLIDSVGRIDDPCDRPVYSGGDGIPRPAFKAPQEGYPNDVCKIEDYKKGETEQGDYPEGAAVIHVARDTPKAVQLRIPAVYKDETGATIPSSMETCCEESRSLDKTRMRYQEMLPPSQDGAPSGNECNPGNPDYPCSGVIGETIREPWTSKVSDKDNCLPLSLRSGRNVKQDWRNLKPLTGWEYINGEKTCDLYPIAENLPSRFNNPLWFKGYGCEKPCHPFYVTTTADYGRFSPNPHTMTQKFFPRSGAFSKLMSAGGMYRNRTLNTSNTKSIV